MGDLFSLSSVWSALSPTEPISQVIIWLMWLIFIGYVAYLTLYYFRTAKRRVHRINEQLAVLQHQAEGPVALRTALRQHFEQQADSLLKKAWQRFDQSLISSPDQSRLYSTVDSQYFFNAPGLTPWLSGNRLMVSVPSMLVAIGVLGTFLGLVIGLSGLDANANDTDTLRAGIGTLISGASVAFTTSIWGVFLSLVAGFIERAYERAIKAALNQLNNQLAGLFPSVSSEQTLMHIQSTNEQAIAALQNLPTQIGAELEKSVQDLSEQMQTALVTALDRIMQPAIDSLVENNQQQSTAVLETLVEQFMEGMNHAGQNQTRQMGYAAERLDGSLDKLSQITKASSEQNQQMIAQHRELTLLFERAIEAMRSSSKYLAASSTQLGGISRDLLAVSRELGSKQVLESTKNVYAVEDKVDHRA